MINFFDDTAPAGKQTLPAFQQNTLLDDPSLYEPDDALGDAVSVALTLGLPLLITGEPGTGKTSLAKHLAWRFNLGELLRLNIKTTSTANDLFYRYDALGHFQYSQNQKKVLSKEEVENRFISYQAIGKAIISEKRKVVLLDEIDKAPRDLPNDILAALEDLSFYVPEIDKTFTAEAGNRPVIVMTSNSEKNLPDAFLRRVIYYNLLFPDPQRLFKIVSNKVSHLTENEIDSIVNHFNELRQDDTLRLQKKPATAELIQWAHLLRKMAFDISLLDTPHRLSEVDKRKLASTYTVLAKTKEDLKGIQKKLLF